MTFDGTTVENDPFLIELREQLTEMETKVNALAREWIDNPSDARARIKYDAEWYRLDAIKTKYENAIKAVIGL